MPAYSFVQYSGDGSTGPFVIPFPYLDPAHVIVRVDNAEAPFSFDSETAISLETAAANGSIVEIRRETPVAERLVDFTDGSVLTEVDLDTASLQQLYLAQETFDLADTAITLEADGVYDFASRRATNLADPTAAQDAVTKAYVDATTPASATAAAASATAAAASATSAASDASAATTAASVAATAQTAAETAQTAAETAAATVEGVPAGGSAGQVLTKQSGADYDVAFTDASGGAIVIEAAGNPDSDDDEADTGGNGSAPIGALWVNGASKVLYASVDASEGAAQWTQIGRSGPIGSIILWPSDSLPDGYLKCDGASLSTTTYADLFAVTGYIYGGSGASFNLPDMRDQFARGASGSRPVGNVEDGQVGDHKHETPFGIDPDGASDLFFEEPDVFGEGGPFTAERTVGAGGSATATDYALTNAPYRAADDEAANETYPKNVALVFAIKHQHEGASDVSSITYDGTQSIVYGAPVGSIYAWGSASNPAGTLECDGSAVSRTTYAELLAIIGTTYGVGDGSTTFNLPDLQNEFIRGSSGSRAVGSSESGQVGDHRHETPLGAVNTGDNRWRYRNGTVDSDQFPWGVGDEYNGTGSTDTDVSGSGNSASDVSYVLTNDPYDGSRDEVSNETRPQNVALMFVIQASLSTEVITPVGSYQQATEATRGGAQLATQPQVDGKANSTHIVTPQTLGATPLPQVAPDVIVEDQKASGTPGGAVNTGFYLSWKKRTLNTEVRDALGITLAGDEVTLPAGTYYAEAQSPGFGANHFRCRIYDETNASELGLSDTGYSGTNAQDWAKACAVFTLAAAANVSVQYQSNYNGSSAANLGAYGSFSGVPEVYTRLKLWRLA